MNACHSAILTGLDKPGVMKQEVFRNDRVGALSDGVFAIAMTLLVLDLKLPEANVELDGNVFTDGIMAQRPRFVSWLVSFAILCRLWITQHALLAAGEIRSRAFTAWNFVFLAVVSVTPFTTSLLSEHPDQRLAVMISSLTLAAGAVALLCMHRAETTAPPQASAGPSRGTTAATPAYLLFSTAVMAVGLASVKATAGILVWAAYPVVASIAARHRPKTEPSST